MISAYLILTGALFAVALCGSYRSPYQPTTATIRAILFLLCTWSVAILFTAKT